jgi:hypothetical protein
MMKRFALIALAGAPLWFTSAGVAFAQPFPMIDQLAQRVVQKLPEFLLSAVGGGEKPTEGTKGRDGAAGYRGAAQ